MEISYRGRLSRFGSSLVFYCFFFTTFHYNFPVRSGCVLHLDELRPEWVESIGLFARFRRKISQSDARFWVPRTSIRFGFRFFERVLLRSVEWHRSLLAARSTRAGVLRCLTPGVAASFLGGTRFTLGCIRFYWVPSANWGPKGVEFEDLSRSVDPLGLGGPPWPRWTPLASVDPLDLGGPPPMASEWRPQLRLFFGVGLARGPLGGPRDPRSRNVDSSQLDRAVTIYNRIKSSEISLFMFDYKKTRPISRNSPSFSKQPSFSHIYLQIICRKTQEMVRNLRGCLWLLIKLFYFTRAKQS